MPGLFLYVHFNGHKDARDACTKALADLKWISVPHCPDMFQHPEEGADRLKDDTVLLLNNFKGQHQTVELDFLLLRALEGEHYAHLGGVSQLFK